MPPVPPRMPGHPVTFEIPRRIAGPRSATRHGAIRKIAIRRSAIRRLNAFGIALTAAVFAVAPTASAAPAALASTPTQASNSKPVPKNADGPHAAANRPLAATKTTRSAGTIVKDVDLGTIALDAKGKYRTPVRGVLVAPDRPKANAPLVIFGHQRLYGCVDTSERYPCTGSLELRLDRGMTYWAQEMARQGYAVLLPDLGPLYVSGDYDTPYSQADGYARITTMLRDAAIKASKGGSTRFGTGLEGKISSGKIAAFGHSRAALLTNRAMSTWAKHGIQVASVMTYGGFYMAELDEPVTEMVADVPYLALFGDYDNDVGFAAERWLTSHLGVKRTNPALVARVPGLGHTYINRELSRRSIDDRIGCDSQPCPSAAAHEAVFTKTSSAWLNATLKHENSTLPLRANSMLGTKLAGTSVTWLAATLGAKTTVFAPRSVGKIETFGRGAKVHVCRYPDPQNPFPTSSDCPIPTSSDIQNVSFVARSMVTATSGVRVRTNVKGANLLALHVNPGDSRVDKRVGSPLRVTVRTASGRAVTLKVAATNPAVKDRTHEGFGAIYAPATVRFALPAWVASDRVTSVELTGDGTSAAVDISRIELGTR